MNVPKQFSGSSLSNQEGKTPVFDLAGAFFSDKLSKDLTHDPAGFLELK